MGGRTLGNENKYETPTLTRNFKKGDFSEGQERLTEDRSYLGIMSKREKRTLGPGVRMRKTKTILKPY